MCYSNDQSLDLLKYTVPICLALLAAVVTLLQVKTNIVSASKVRWIDEFRNILSEYVSEIAKGLESYDGHFVDMHKAGKESNSEQNENFKKYIESINIVTRLNFKLGLLLNSQNSIHVRLEKELKEVQDIINEMATKLPKPKREDVQECMRNFFVKTPIITKIAKEIIESETKETRKLFVID